MPKSIRCWRKDKMVTYNNLVKEYKDKLDDLTPEDVMSILQSLIKQFYDAYDVYDIEKMEFYKRELDDAMRIFDGKFRNIGVYVWRTKLYYESSIHQYKLRKSILRDSFHNLESYIHLYGQVESKFLHLNSILRTYYYNYSNGEIDEIIGHLLVEHNMEEVCDKNIYEELWDNFGINYFLMGNLDNLIGEVRDEILETMKIIDERYYSPNDSPDVLEDSISDVRNHVHELIEEDFYRNQREKGIVDIELGWINVFQIEHELNNAYGFLKKEIEEMFEGDNGFNRINKFYHEMRLEDNPNLQWEDEEKWHPKYNIMETRFIPPEHLKDDKRWEKYYWWKNRDDI